MTTKKRYPSNWDDGELVTDPVPLKLFNARELGRNQSGLKIERIAQERRLESLCLYGRQRNHPYREYSVNCMDIDRNENNFLLSGGSAGHVDVSNLLECEPGVPINEEEEENSQPTDKKFSKRIHNHQVNTCQWYPNGLELFATAGQDGKLCISDTNTMSQVDNYTLEKTIQFHWNECNKSSPLIAAADSTSNVKLCDIRTGSCVSEIRNGATAMTVRWYPSDTHILATGDHAGLVKLWDTRNGRKALAAQQTSLGDSSIGGLRFNHDGSRLVALSTALTVAVFNTMPFEEIMIHKTRNAGASYDTGARYTRIGHLTAWLPCQVRFDICDDGDGLRVAMPFGPSVHWIHFKPNGEYDIKLLKGHFDIVSSCCYRKKYQQLLTSATGADRAVLIWASKGDKAKKQLKIESAAARADNWSDDEDSGQQFLSTRGFYNMDLRGDEPSPEDSGDGSDY